MHNFKALRIIPLVLGFVLVTFGCDTSNTVSSKLATSATEKNQASNFSDFKISAEAVPEGILVTFFNYSNIPQEIEKLILSVWDWGDSKDAVMKIWDTREPLAVMNSLSKMHGHSTYENVIEQIRQTGTITFPFVQPGQKYEITALFYDSNDVQQGWTEKMATAECVADRGIYFTKDITINMNDARTGVALSSEPAFTSDVHLEQMEYYIFIKGDYAVPLLGDCISSGITNDSFWNFEPRFREHLIKAGVPNGDYPACAGICLKIIYDNISWWLESVKTPVFIYSF